MKKGKKPTAGQCKKKSFKNACSHCGKCDDAGVRRKLADEIPGTSRRNEHSHRLVTGAAPVLVVFLGLFLPTALALVLANRRNKRLAEVLRTKIARRLNLILENVGPSEAKAEARNLATMLRAGLDTISLEDLHALQDAAYALESRKLVL